MATAIDYTGQRYWFLVCLGCTGMRTTFGRMLWRWMCDCGQTTDVEPAKVRSGNTKSCGCYGDKLRKALGTPRKSHGLSTRNSATYRTWNHMLQRITNPKCHEYKWYGGRGIQVCERWRSFDNFFADMGERPLRTTIDRIDPNGHYEPGNCRWASTFVQARNKAASKLNDDIVNEIHGRYEHGESRKSIAIRLGLAVENVRSIVTGRSWKEFMPGVSNGVAA